MIPHNFRHARRNLQHPSTIKLAVLYTFTWKDNIINRGKQQFHIVIMKVKCVQWGHRDTGSVHKPPLNTFTFIITIWNCCFPLFMMLSFHVKVYSTASLIVLGCCRFRRACRKLWGINSSQTLDDAAADQYRYYEHVRTGARSKFKRRHELVDPPPVDLRLPPSEANSGQDIHFQCQLPSSVILL